LELVYAAAAVLGGFVALVWGADRFVAGAAALAQNLGVSPLVVGLTIVGFGTSAPEMLVSSVAAYEGAPGLSIGNAIGSNIANVAMVLGIAALVNPILVHEKVLRSELPVMLGVMLLAGGLMLDGHLGLVDGIVLLTGMFLMIAWVVRDGLKDRGEGDALPDDLADEMPDPMSTPMAVLWLVLGLAVLLASSKALVWGAEIIALALGVPELVVGLTVVAFGTSLPELAATVVAAKRNEHDIAVGNVIGSNMFNTLGVLGLPGVIRPSEVEESVLYRDVPVMLGVSVLLWLLARVLRPYRKLSRVQGAILLVAFLAYVTFVGVDSAMR